MVLSANQRLLKNTETSVCRLVIRFINWFTEYMLLFNHISQSNRFDVKSCATGFSNYNIINNGAHQDTPGSEKRTVWWKTKEIAKRSFNVIKILHDTHKFAHISFHCRCLCQCSAFPKGKKIESHNRSTYTLSMLHTFTYYVAPLIFISIQFFLSSYCMECQIILDWKKGRNFFSVDSQCRVNS